MHRINWLLVLGLAGCLAFWGVVMSYALHRMYDIALAAGVTGL